VLWAKLEQRFIRRFSVRTASYGRMTRAAWAHKLLRRVNLRFYEPRFPVCVGSRIRCRMAALPGQKPRLLTSCE